MLNVDLQRAIDIMARTDALDSLSTEDRGLVERAYAFAVSVFKDGVYEWEWLMWRYEELRDTDA